MVEPTKDMRVFHERRKLAGRISEFGACSMRVMFDDGSDDWFLLPGDPGSDWAIGHLRPIDEQPKPPELGCFREGATVPVAAPQLAFCKLQNPTGHRIVCSVCQGKYDWETVSTFKPGEARAVGYAMYAHCPSCNVVFVGALVNDVESDARVLRSDKCPHCADNAGMLDAACKRLGDREVELASALRAVDRLTAELRDYKGRARYRQ